MQKVNTGGDNILDDMKARIRLSSLLSLVLCCLGSPAALAQKFIWVNDQGQTWESRDFAAIPETAKPHLRCIAKVMKVLSGERIEVEGGHPIRLIGVDAPQPPLAWSPDKARKARIRLAELVSGKTVTLTFDNDFKDGHFDTLAYVWDEKGQLINAQLLTEGLARALETVPNLKQAPALRAAEAEARQHRRGLWASQRRQAQQSDESFQGFSLGLYSRRDDYDYSPFLREMKSIGCRHVLLVTPWFMDHFDSCKIQPKSKRTTSLPMVHRVVKQAKALGLSVGLMPIVLLWKPGKDHWRGNIAPKEEADWFRSYQEFIAAFADLAEDAEADLLMIGSEFSSLEQKSGRWRAVAQEARKRFRGRLSYSANWDHVDAIDWWSEVDLIGMTGYHSLTDKNEPTVEELCAGWKKIRQDLLKVLDSRNKPYFFSEIGYASLDGINKNPWDYVSPDTVDLDEQKDCYEAYFRTWAKAPANFRGAFFYNWWRNRDDDDQRQYTIYGKPAEELIRRRFR